MASEQICEILNIMSEDYDQGVYPGRNSEGLNPEWPCDPFHVLIATILSQRTRDDNTRKASDALFHRYDSVDEIADADPEEIAELVRPAGFPKQKGKAIVDCCRMLRDVYGGKVPEETEELVTSCRWSAGRRRPASGPTPCASRRCAWTRTSTGYQT